MAISHVIRGEDHLSNTPKHILLFRALGATVPAFAHLPLILNPDRTKMSKRKSQTAVADYIGQGYVREAILNPAARIRFGYQPVMPAYQGVVTEEQLIELVEYMKGNPPEPVAAAPAGEAH